MASPDDVVMDKPRGDEAHDGSPAQQQQQPFTVQENIHQLNDIDRCIVQLMHHTTTALSALTTSAGSSSGSADLDGSGKSALDAPSQKAAFRAATDSFLTTLHSVDVWMKRQVLALEEAGIVNLSNPPRLDPNGAARATLKPNGLGTVGNLDVGWLNSRSTMVERDMEAELWHDARELLERRFDKVETN